MFEYWIDFRMFYRICDYVFGCFMDCLNLILVVITCLVYRMM